MVRKRDGRWRFCIDYQELNKVTKKDSYLGKLWLPKGSGEHISTFLFKNNKG